VRHSIPSIASVLRRSLTTAETDARRLRRKNAKALRLTIKASAKAKAMRDAQEQERLLRRLAGEHMIKLSDNSDDDDPLAADAYTEDRKGKGVARKW
jgi:hypothetical protein